MIKQILYYKIIDQIGHGGMGRVYRAIDERKNAKVRDVAIKVLKSELMEDRDIIMRFIREPLIESKLSGQPNIIDILEFGVPKGTVDKFNLYGELGRYKTTLIEQENEHDQWYYITMRYMKGGDLESRIRNSGKMSLKMVYRILNCIGDALDYTHKYGYIHRDIKSSNIVFDEYDTPYLTDFGVAKAVSSENGMTSVGTVIGTLEYMAPEQLMDKNVDYRCDIYSMGIVLYQMLVGKVPFAVESKNNQSSEYIRIELMKKIMGMKPSKIKSLRPDCPSSLERVVLKMLEKDPEKRYGSFKEIKSNIKNTSNIESIRLLQTDNNARHNHRAKKGNYLVALWISILLTFLIVLLLEIIKI